MIDWIEGLPLSVPAGWLIAFVLHATVLLTMVWIIERLGGLKHPGWAEWAWRVALFGAFVSVAVEQLPWDATNASSGGAVSMTVAGPSPQSLRVADHAGATVLRAAAATATGRWPVGSAPTPTP